MVKVKHRTLIGDFSISYVHTFLLGHVEQIYSLEMIGTIVLRFFHLIAQTLVEYFGDGLHVIVLDNISILIKLV